MNQFESNATLEYGCFSHARLEAVVNEPASDKLSFPARHGLRAREDGYS
jgi:hypothetical protein